MGEVNVSGIGAPIIFIRLAGCHLRCYKSTLNKLCDTPNALDIHSGAEKTLESIIEDVNEISEQSGGIKLVCLSGGDPLFRSEKELCDLFWSLGQNGYSVSVETSGTLSIQPYHTYKWVHYVLDYKSKSAGVKQPFMESNLPLLTNRDIIKFVLLNHDDFEEFITAYHHISPKTEARIAVGLYWGGLIKYNTLIERLIEEGIFGKVLVNFQTHKLATLYDATDRVHFDTLSIPEML